MECDQPITVFEEGGEQNVNVTSECLRVVPIEDRDYNKFYNKPCINGVELIGDRTSHEIKVQDEMDEITPQEIDNILYA